MKEYHFEEIRGKKLLILGEAGSGKTKMTASLLKEAQSMLDQKSITVLDFAPSGIERKGTAVGGKLVSDYSGCSFIHCSPSIRAPRLEGRTTKEVLDLARHNASLTSSCLNGYLSTPTPTLFINDLTIHLHAGDPDLILLAISRAETFVGNAYKGSILEDDRSSGISQKERSRLDKVSMAVDILVDLSTRGAVVGDAPGAGARAISGKAR